LLGELADRGEMRGIQQAIEEIAPDVIHINKQCVDDGLAIVKAAKKTGIPTVATIHVTRGMASLGAAMGWVRDRITVSTIRKYTPVLVTTAQRSLDDWRKLIPESKMILIPNGTKLVKDNPEVSFHERLNLETNSLIIGTAARIEEQKNPLFFPKVVASLPENVHMVWIGDGRLRGELEAEIEKQEVGDRFHLLGWQDNAAWLARQCGRPAKRV